MADQLDPDSADARLAVVTEALYDDLDGDGDLADFLWASRGTRRARTARARRVLAALDDIGALA